jgi:hypothetical protein
MQKVIEKIVKSRKFWYGFTIVMMVMFSEQLGISEIKINTLSIIAVALIVAQGLADRGCKS